jgi:hypothetical protein
MLTLKFYFFQESQNVEVTYLASALTDFCFQLFLWPKLPSNRGGQVSKQKIIKYFLSHLNIKYLKKTAARKVLMCKSCRVQISKKTFLNFLLVLVKQNCDKMFFLSLLLGIFLLNKPLSGKPTINIFKIIFFS